MPVAEYEGRQFKRYIIQEQNKLCSLQKVHNNQAHGESCEPERILSPLRRSEQQLFRYWVHMQNCA